FRYENAKDLAIKEISLTIKRGSLVAVVGASGSGKSTLIDIICGLLQPCSGNICIDKTKITGRTMMAWQQKIGYVGQNIFVLDDTIRNNIAFGVPSSEIDINQVKSAAEQAELADFIERQMPNQYLTKIGERGAKISGGQRQRIGLARAFYKKPDLLILDEATSALDRKTEKIILNRIKNYVELGMTVIKIAHRLPDLELFDQVVEIKNGKINVKQKRLPNRLPVN
ncbi:MAG: ATP-binding cassette domain-containing protein, partial [Gammaproteobacteria bacterium]|nr:ATP-binding cassette domain-containing protein [Gammaproteobacteria bacterium]